MKILPTMLVIVALSLLFFGGQLFAESVFFGSWRVEEAPGTLKAATINESGNETGKICFLDSQKCIWYLTMPTACKENNTFPALLNSNEGSSSIFLMCLGAQTGTSQFIYAFSDFDAADSLMRKALRVAFAFPLESDQFRVVRFKLDGSSTALSELDKLAQKVIQQNSNSTKDEVL